jgi:hypothetical protein
MKNTHISKIIQTLETDVIVVTTLSCCLCGKTEQTPDIRNYDYFYKKGFRYHKDSLIDGVVCKKCLETIKTVK